MAWNIARKRNIFWRFSSVNRWYHQSRRRAAACASHAAVTVQDVTGEVCSVLSYTPLTLLRILGRYSCREDYSEKLIVAHYWTSYIFVSRLCYVMYYFHNRISYVFDMNVYFQVPNNELYCIFFITHFE